MAAAHKAQPQRARRRHGATGASCNTRLRSESKAWLFSSVLATRGGGGELEPRQPPDLTGVFRSVKIFNRLVEAVAIWPALMFLARLEENCGVRIADCG